MAPQQSLSGQSLLGYAFLAPSNPWPLLRLCPYYSGFSQNPKSVFGLKILSISYALIPCFFKILATGALCCSSIDQEKTDETA
jgi:hypothetical protein